MRTYNAVGYALLTLHALVSAFLARRNWVSAEASWSVGSISCSSGWWPASICLRSCTWASRIGARVQGMVRQSTTLLCNAVAIYVNPRSWVNRHRHHHAFSDRDGDPNKLGNDGFWKTLYLCLFPYRCQFDLARDPIFETWPMRLAASPAFAVAAQLSSFAFIWGLVSDWVYALALWCSVRLVGLWTNMVQNYWTHDRRFGARRYHDDDNAMNIGDWLPIMATFSACLQNNHHHHPHFLRLSHSPDEYDFGFQVVRLMKRLGLVRPSNAGARLPAGLELKEVGL